VESVDWQSYFYFQNGIDDVKTHKYFKSLDWDAAFQRKLKVCVVHCCITYTSNFFHGSPQLSHKSDIPEIVVTLINILKMAG